jgi:hypothetical protein
MMSDDPAIQKLAYHDDTAERKDNHDTWNREYQRQHSDWKERIKQREGLHAWLVQRPDDRLQSLLTGNVSVYEKLVQDRNCIATMKAMERASMSLVSNNPAITIQNQFDDCQAFNHTNPQDFIKELQMIKQSAALV